MAYTRTRRQFGETLTLKALEYQRNGTAGTGFAVVDFRDTQFPNMRLLGIIHSSEDGPDYDRISVIAPNDLTQHFRNEFYREPLGEWFKEYDGSTYPMR